MSDRLGLAGSAGPRNGGPGVASEVVRNGPMNDGRAWFLLPVLPLTDGGRARRISRLIDRQTLLSIVLSATGALVGISFELVEHHSASALPPDPYLGRVMVDGRTICFGLVDTTRTSLTFTALSVRADAGLVRALRRGRELSFELKENTLTLDLSDLAASLDTAMRSICDPAYVPLDQWLKSAP